MSQREKAGIFSAGYIPPENPGDQTILYITNDAGILNGNQEGPRNQEGPLFFKVAHEMAKVAIHLAQHKYGWIARIGEHRLSDENMLEGYQGRLVRVADVLDAMDYIEAQMLRVREYVTMGCTVLRGDHCQTCRWSKERECYMCIKETIQ